MGDQCRSISSTLSVLSLVILMWQNCPVERSNGTVRLAETWRTACRRSVTHSGVNPTFDAELHLFRRQDAFLKPRWKDKEVEVRDDWILLIFDSAASC
uniref:C2 domain-containing protein n=1 Tax=Chromera velia CCMP2878 TaxID=1169474 RepID=A0A0G4HZA7_9ALVE|eukprot:Cvel_9649.t1-p1 / transcript=Cvel_9649.t1 / gene=Cvel_9649 / organism=Chromera_velia_CCMP2878 / gene_product=hypothetical protein / transcript_product=hypothetical protein / location=Cvel_scaffold561:58985-62586(-) / protein_length=97 / sequence_SO=supercontig / SO=protein_coding / is_pseudo=false